MKFAGCGNWERVDFNAAEAAFFEFKNKISGFPPTQQIGRRIG
jgi:hypothetical protein